MLVLQHFQVQSRAAQTLTGLNDLGILLKYRFCSVDLVGEVEVVHF